MVAATRDTLESTGGESFLRLVQRSQRGRLKLYIGYSSGVGKTWQMLQEAIRLREQHIDVAAGFVDTHGKEDVESVLSELEIIERKRQTYRGIEVTEMDIDAILQRRPTVALVDDLAHTNVPGSRNTRRHEDVEELLAAGIHVISTLNIQHLESLCETVEYATGIKVKDRLSDRVLAESDEIVNVDISIMELERRLTRDAEHNYRESDSSIAVRFSSENLELLRELTRQELFSPDRIERA